jgi:hypothetical protein
MVRLYERTVSFICEHSWNIAGHSWQYGVGYAASVAVSAFLFKVVCL